mgnify:CR=1 FL=1
MQTFPDLMKQDFIKDLQKTKKGKNIQLEELRSLMTLSEVNDFDSFSGMMQPNTILIDADEEPHNDILQNIIKGEELACYVTDREGGRVFMH